MLAKQLFFKLCEFPGIREEHVYNDVIVKLTLLTSVTLLLLSLHYQL